VGAIKLPGQRFQLGLGHQRIRVAVGGPHPLGHHRGQRLGEPVADVAELVELAALDDGVVEHLGDGAARRLGVVDHDQDRPGDLQPRLPQADQQVTHHRGVLGGAFGQSQGDLGAVDGDAQGDHTAVVGHPDAVHQERHQVEAGQVLGEQLGQGVLGSGDESARDRRLGGPRSG
jgi:hypothetical protein